MQLRKDNMHCCHYLISMRRLIPWITRYYLCNCMQTKLLDCVNGIERWMASNHLKLNPSKSEFMWCANARRIYNIDDSEFILPDGAVKASTSVQDLGAYLDQAMTLQDGDSCFYQL